MGTIDLSVEPRERVGKGAARAVRREGGLPATLYGRKRSAVALTANAKDFETRIGALEGSHLVRLQSRLPDINGCLALVKEIQRHPVTRRLLHADLYEVDVDTKLRIRVPLHFVGRAAGVELGGILQPIRREIEVMCLPTQIPASFEVDVTHLGIHDAVHVSDLTPPPGVEIPHDVDFELVTVLPPVVEEVKVAAAEVGEGAPAEGAAAPEAAGKEAQKPEAVKGAS